MKCSKPGVVLALLVTAAILLADRAAWASVAQWREDAATNLWLGYTRSPLDAPVGLVSSVEVPNPNGVVLASFFLSRLPDLWAVSVCLGLLQAVFIGWVCWLITRDWALFLLVVGPLWSCVTLRGASVELSNQLLFIPVNLLFFTAIILHLRKPSPWVVPAAVGLSLLAASLYLAGVANAVSYGIVLAIVLVIRPPRGSWRAWLAPLIISGAILGLSLWLTWLPYLQAVGFDQVLHGRATWHLTRMERILVSAESVVGFPYWLLAHFGTGLLSSTPQVDNRILSATAWSGYRLLIRLGFFQGLICYASILVALVAHATRRRPGGDVIRAGMRPAAIVLLLMTVFIVGCYALSPLSGGPVWVRNERLDQVTQFLPLVLLIWFSIPFVLESSEYPARLLRGLTCVSSISYTLLSLAIGTLVVVENLGYRGNVLPTADVPLFDKLHVVDFVASDWRSRSVIKEIPVDYDLGDRNWDWVRDFGRLYKKWYPAPYTIGRALDYQLLRSYGLQNSKEGVQLRSFGKGRYLVTYAFRRAPVVDGCITQDYVFGRLRVTIVER